MRHRASDPVTWSDYIKLLRRVKELETQLGDAFETITTGDDAQAEFWNEHEDKINRLRRQQARLEKRMDDLEG